MKHLGRVICVIVPLLALDSCLPQSLTNRESTLKVGMTSDEVLGVMGSPDDLYGSVINADGQTVTVWAYNAKNVNLYAQRPVWLFVADGRYVQSTQPGRWHRDSIFIVHTRLPHAPPPQKNSATIKTVNDTSLHADFKVMLGGQFLSKPWSPYRTPFVVGGAIQATSGGIWYDMLVSFGRQGELDGEGHPAGAGNSLFQVQTGVGSRWDLGIRPFSVYAVGGFTYVYGKFTKYNTSHPHFLSGVDEPFYDEISGSGHFWGGYGRFGLDLYAWETWYVGLGAFGVVTTNRRILGQSLNANSFGVALEVGTYR